ncbi:MAG: DUF1573 domain-containing protein [candidate division Zixibacteria bacterium]|nr:DUF1573 domain-containing protein [candidate division Zixibacteria bacterium]
MTRRVMSAICLTLGLVGLGGVTAAAPLLVIDQEEFDFGYAPQNSKISHTFHLRNAGDDTLLINRVVPGCGCTQVPLKKSVLAPGESTELAIIFSTGQYNGPVTKKPRLETNDAIPSRNLTFHTTVITRPDSTYPIQVRPYKLDISQFGQTVRDHMRFSISNVSDQAISINLVSSADDLMTVTFPEQVAAGKSGEGSLKLNESAQAQSFETSITLQLNDSASTRYTIPIKRTVQAQSAGVSSGGNASSK